MLSEQKLSATTLIIMSPEDLHNMLVNAIAEGVVKGISIARDTWKEEEPINTKGAMALAGYKDKDAFRKFLKENSIQPHTKKGRASYYLPSQITAAQRLKGVKS